MTDRAIPTSYVYILVSADGALGKVGTSVDPETRRRSADLRKGVNFKVAWTNRGDEVLEGFLQHLLVHRRIEHDWFDFSGLEDIASVGSSAVALWNALGQPPEYRSTLFRCAQYPLATQKPLRECVAIPRRRNIPVDARQVES